MRSSILVVALLVASGCTSASNDSSGAGGGAAGANSGGSAGSSTGGTGGSSTGGTAGATGGTAGSSTGGTAGATGGTAGSSTGGTAGSTGGTSSDGGAACPPPEFTLASCSPVKFAGTAPQLAMTWGTTAPAECDPLKSNLYDLTMEFGPPVPLTPGCSSVRICAYDPACSPSYSPGVVLTICRDQSNKVTCQY
jgi:hypothetical protein